MPNNRDVRMAIKNSTDSILVNPIMASITAISMLIFTYSCNPVRDTTSIPYQFNVDSIYTHESIKYSELFSSFEIIPLETTEDNHFGAMGVIIRIVGDHIYLLDRTKYKTIDIYTTKGDFINRIQNVGRGPGEYVNPAELDIDPKTGNVYIYDLATNRIILFDFKTSNPIESFKTPDPGNFQSFVKQGNSVLYFKDWGNPDDPNDAMLHITNLNGDILNKHLFFSTDNDLGSGSPNILSTSSNFFKSPNGIKIFWSWSNTVYNYHDIELSPFVKFEGDIPKMTSPSNRLQRDLGITGYSDNGNLALIKHNKFLFMLLNLKDKTTICAKRYVDDLTKLSYLSINSIWDEYIVAVYNPAIEQAATRFLNRDSPKANSLNYPLLDKISSGDIDLDHKVRSEMIEKIERNLMRGGGTTNPVIVLFKIKDELISY